MSLCLLNLTSIPPEMDNQVILACEIKYSKYYCYDYSAARIFYSGTQMLGYIGSSGVNKMSFCKLVNGSFNLILKGERRKPSLFSLLKEWMLKYTAKFCIQRLWSVFCFHSLLLYKIYFFLASGHIQRDKRNKNIEVFLLSFAHLLLLEC